MSDTELLGGYDAEKPGAPERFIVRAGSMIYGNVAVERDTREGVAVLILTHKKGDRWTIRESAVDTMTPFTPKER